MSLFILFPLRFVAFIVGFSLALYVLISVVRTFVLPRSAPDKLVRTVFIAMRKLFDLRISIERTYERRDEIMALRTLHACNFAGCLACVYFSGLHGDVLGDDGPTPLRAVPHQWLLTVHAWLCGRR